EVLGMAEEDGPVIAEPFVEADLALGRLGGEIGGGVPKSDGHFGVAPGVQGTGATAGFRRGAERAIRERARSRVSRRSGRRRTPAAAHAGQGPRVIASPGAPPRTSESGC